MVECKIELKFVKLGAACYGMCRGKMEPTYVKLEAAYYGMCSARPSDTNIHTVEPPITDPPNSGPPPNNGPPLMYRRYSRRRSTFSAPE